MLYTRPPIFGLQARKQWHQTNFIGINNLRTTLKELYRGSTRSGLKLETNIKLTSFNTIYSIFYMLLIYRVRLTLINIGSIFIRYSSFTNTLYAPNINTHTFAKFTPV